MQSNRNGLTTKVPVSIAAAKANPEYWSFFQHIYAEQASRLIQRAWHKRKGRNAKKLDPIVDRGFENKMSFVYEIEGDGDRSAAHARLINQGKWAELDFADPEFIANIYKALRLKLLNANQTFYALYLHAAQAEFKHSINIHKFDEKGPYSFNNITSATKPSKERFKELLNEIPESEKCYASVNLSRKREVIFLYMVLSDENYMDRFLENGNFQKIMHAYLEKNAYSILNEMLKYVSLLGNSDVNKHKEAVKKLKEFLIKHETKFCEELAFSFGNEANMLIYASREAETKLENDPHFQSAKFQHTLFRAYPDMPSLEVSPDHDPKNPRSPTCCMIALPMPVQMAMQTAFFGKDAAEAFYNVGKITVTQLRELDENPENFGLKNQARGIECPGPRVINNLAPHKYNKPHKFTLMHHDLRHLWGNSTNFSKNLYRYLRKLFSYDEKFYASQKIWKATDMDLSFYNFRKVQAQGNPALIQIEMVQAYYNVITLCVGQDFFVSPDKTSDYLLVMRDMAMDREDMIKWPRLLDMNGLRTIPANIFSIAPDKLWMGMKWEGFPDDHFINQDFNNFQQVSKTMEEIVNVNKEKSTIFHILAYRLRNNENGMQLLKQLDEIGLDKFVTWPRNSGLMLISSPKTFLDKITDDVLYQKLQNELNRHQMKPEQKLNTQMFFAKSVIEEMEKPDLAKGCRIL